MDARNQVDNSTKMSIFFEAIKIVMQFHVVTNLDFFPQMPHAAAPNARTWANLGQATSPEHQPTSQQERLWLSAKDSRSGHATRIAVEHPDTADSHAL